MRGRFILTALLLALLCAGCGAGQNPPAEESLPPETETVEPEDPVELESPEEPPFLEGESVLLTLDAPLSDGRTLTLKAVGKELENNHVGVREVRVYDGETLLQTVLVRGPIEAEWGEGMADDFYDYTECWSVEDTMDALDLNFDGDTDFGLFGGIANNTIPYYYWTWDSEAGQYRYIGVLQGAEVLPETKEVRSDYKGGYNGAYYQTDYYQPDKDGNLYLVRQERTVYGFVPNEDVDAGGTIETWVPREGLVIRPRPEEYQESDWVLVRRTIPLYEVNENNEASYFLEIWEPVDGELQLISREPYTYHS